MSWTADEQRAVSNVLLGSWPGTITFWGKDAFAAYLGELEARGLSAETALVAIRSVSGQFPPSAPELAAAARQHPDRPTFEECLAQLYGPGGVFGFKRSGVTVSPWVLKFTRDAGSDWLRLQPIDDPDEGKWARKNIKEAWDRFLEANEGRAVAEIAARSGRGSLGRLDPLAALNGPLSKELHDELVPRGF
jgi:hypothetical protein